ncbi:hypothetical protein OBO34_19520 [Clostridiales Family XIII bacterium ASD5510]|uniref:Uncharacterized protein n=1 Tax=Hominibacterium faecale TaxID=2839743 RepID=A0A9J6QYD3_9FIRM|nr:hypothetical protein [Hominibacterium faecale]MCU7380505.1 hypothetical protein [Hominibacterium faecale]
MERVELYLKRLRKGENNIEYWLSLEKELDNFFENEATEEEDKILREELRKDWGLMEHLFMICSGYRWEKAQALIKRYHEEGRSAGLEEDIRKFWNEEAVGSEKDEMRKNLPTDLLV